MRLLVLLAATASLAACADPNGNLADNQAGNNVAAADVVADAAEEPARDEASAPPAQGGDDTTTPPPANGADEEADQCNASDYQYLVGKPRSAIPPEPEGANWRVTCTGCPVTMDYSPARMNIFYDEESEIVETVRCG